MNFDNLIINEIVGVYTPYYETFVTKVMNNRSSFGICFAYSGKVSFIHNHKTYLCDVNHAVFLPKDTDYIFNVPDKESSFAIINFNCKSNLKDFVSFIINDNEYFLKLHQNITKLILFKPENYHYKSFSLMYDIFAKLLMGSPKKGVDPVLHPALNYMENNLSNFEISNSVLAEQCGISEVYFRKLFKKCLGISPIRYLSEMRIEKAKNMLESGNSDFSKIAGDCGYSNIYYFFKVFKDKTGLTPTKYRETYKINIF